MLKNFLVSAWLATPLCGEPPAIDGILAWELSMRLGYKHANKMGRWTPASEIKEVPIPLAKRTIDGRDIYCCSNPIMSPLLAPEWVDRTSKRFESGKMALLIAPEHRKSVMVASGPYKSRYVPERIRLIERVCWFVRGDRTEMRKLLKAVYSIGRHRKIGYGMVWQWTFDEVEDDYSIFAPHKGKQVLMKTLPMGAALQIACGFRHGFGGYKIPYWFPAYQCEIAKPC
jgi:hypothetical protein